MFLNFVPYGETAMYHYCKKFQLSHICAMCEKPLRSKSQLVHDNLPFGMPLEALEDYGVSCVKCAEEFYADL